MGVSRWPFYAGVLWVVSLLGWWGFAFYPTPSEPPAWLEAARVACFGTMENGLPDSRGWILLVLAPLSFLIGLYFLWGHEFLNSLKIEVSTNFGKAILILALLGFSTEAFWISLKIQTAQKISNWNSTDPVSDQLSENYPIGTTLAPDFQLLDQKMKRISLAQFRGTPLVLTFAFAHCQSMCPLVIEKTKDALKELPATPLLIVTLDPWRDTPNRLPSLMEHWELDNRAHVLSDKNVETVLNVIKSFKIPFDRNVKSGDVTHPGLIFIIDAEGKISYSFNNPPSAWIREALHRLLNRNKAENDQKVVQSL